MGRGGRVGGTLQRGGVTRVAGSLCGVVCVGPAHRLQPGAFVSPSSPPLPGREAGQRAAPSKSARVLGPGDSGHLERGPPWLQWLREVQGDGDGWRLLGGAGVRQDLSSWLLVRRPMASRTVCLGKPQSCSVSLVSFVFCSQHPSCHICHAARSVVCGRWSAIVCWWRGAAGACVPRAGRAGELRPEQRAARGDRPLVMRASDGSRSLNLGHLCRFGGVFCG